MIKKIIFSLIFFCLVIAIPLSLAGVTRVELGGAFLSLLKTTNNDLNNYAISIPRIPSVPKLEQVSGFWSVINVLVSFVNGFVNLLNFFVTIVNYAIQVIQFLVLLVRNMIIFRSSLTQWVDDFPYIS